MPVGPTAHGFTALNSSPSVQGVGTHEQTQLVRNPYPNHVYHPRTKRMGKVSKYRALCMNQQEMAERWKNIRKALATIRCSTRKSLAAAKPAPVSAARTQWEVSIVRTGSIFPESARSVLPYYLV
jgi:hypothetical protein